MCICGGLRNAHAQEALEQVGYDIISHDSHMSTAPRKADSATYSFQMLVEVKLTVDPRQYLCSSFVFRQ